MDNGDRVLLVEGQDDKHVVFNICAFNSSQCPTFHIVEE